MLDIKYIKENPEDVIERLARKGKDAREDIARILELDGQRRAMIAETEALKAEQNKVSKEIPKLKKEGKDVAPIFAEMKELSDKAKANDLKLLFKGFQYIHSSWRPLFAGYALFILVIGVQFC